VVSAPQRELPKIPKYPITVLAQLEKRQLAQLVVSAAPCT